MEWTGDWSDRSPKWTPALRAEVCCISLCDLLPFLIFISHVVANSCYFFLGGGAIQMNSTDEDDGTFFMSFEDFLSNFDSVNVCMTRGGTRYY